MKNRTQNITQNIQRAYNKFIPHTYNTGFIQHLIQYDNIEGKPKTQAEKRNIFIGVKKEAHISGQGQDSVYTH